MNEDDVVDYFTKNRYYDRFDETRWREQLEEHPLLMSKPPTNPDEIPPLVEAIRQLKYGEDCNSPQELATQYKIDGNELYKQKQFKDAIANYKKSLDYVKDDNSLHTRQLKSIIYCNIAACHYMRKDFQRAIDDCKESLKLNPDNVRAKQRMQDSLRCWQEQRNLLSKKISET